MPVASGVALDRAALPAGEAAEPRARVENHPRVRREASERAGARGCGKIPVCVRGVVCVYGGTAVTGCGE